MSPKLQFYKEENLKTVEAVGYVEEILKEMEMI